MNDSVIAFTPSVFMQDPSLIQNTFDASHDQLTLSTPETIFIPVKSKSIVTYGRRPRLIIWTDCF